MTTQTLDNLNFIPSALRTILRAFQGIDFWLLGATAFLIMVGLNVLHFSQHTQGYFDKQLQYMWAGLALSLAVSRIPYKLWTNKYMVSFLYLLNLALLVAVMLKGHSAQGAQRWLALGPITLQPSEVAKPIVIFSLAAWLRRFPINSFFDIFKILIILGPPAVLVFKQPDLGTSLTFGAVFLGLSYWAGATITDILVLISPLISLILNAVNKEWWLYFLGALFTILLFFWRRLDFKLWLRLLLIIAIVGANYGFGVARPHLWGVLKEYQQKRLTSFVNPYDDPRGSGYHILQSLIAIGSGGVAGAGLGHGNQAQGAFIPERHTDFIFAVIGEELGFKICALIVLAYGVICVRALFIALQSRGDPAGAAIAIGLMCMFLFHSFINIGMTIGIMPVAGVPLPFLSYGGTALIVDLVSIGLLQSIYYHNPKEQKDIWG
ncbi:MAG TPA: rod shape-determining protein RodA [Candidatus Obscuribacter sp.]|nr:rod shape-determining protein RodA [Candidatus Obscuribacter sp.]MBL8083899.1 rod shape-determining protein RodA [Candidatus Obscuribacter sp.]HMW90984.1 rod shape-determining protein RodA [Candidatus Obscuribacter sp.]HMX45237.1 rod shape-determining protein RodA [Candidatus Obscuribacter sp.]HMY51886.1 rod shape-determining protein RodA [Candidatus Obscuribacter sp.]